VPQKTTIPPKKMAKEKARISAFSFADYLIFLFSHQL
jgi:hypothetical protein